MVRLIWFLLFATVFILTPKWVMALAVAWLIILHGRTMDSIHKLAQYVAFKR